MIDIMIAGVDNCQYVYIKPTLYDKVRPTGIIPLTYRHISMSKRVKYTNNPESIIARLPRPLLGKVLEFIGEKRCIKVDTIDDSIVISRQYNGGPYHVQDCDGHTVFAEDICMSNYLLYIFNKTGLYWSELMRDIDVSHPRPNKYRY